ncbi:unnamed protein product [Closterium sp. NIES-54]
MTTLRVLLHVAAQRDYELQSLDFSTAFLQGSLHEEIWLRRPPGFTGSFPPGTQWSLWRPVYGLCQAPCEWHDTVRTTLAAPGFAPSTADPSLFLRTDTLLPPFYILVYVDDLVFATADTAGLAHVKSELQKRHTCTDLGELRSYLGLQITRDRAQRTITLTQSHMVQQVLQRFDFTYSSPQATPLSTRHSLSALPSDESVEPSGPYPELVGCLMYLMTCTRPDLAYPLSILARYVAPGRHRPEHMAAAKRVLRYLCSTSGLGLVLGGRSPVVLTGHADTSWVDDLAMHRSSQGYTFSLDQEDYDQPGDPEGFPKTERELPNPGFVPLSAEEGNEVIDSVTRADFEGTQRENREFQRGIVEYENERCDMQRAASNSPTNNGGEGSSNPANSPSTGQAEDAPLDGSGQAGAGGNATRNNGGSRYYAAAGPQRHSCGAEPKRNPKCCELGAQAGCHTGLAAAVKHAADVGSPLRRRLGGRPRHSQRF